MFDGWITSYPHGRVGSLVSQHSCSDLRLPAVQQRKSTAFQIAKNQNQKPQNRNQQRQQQTTKREQHRSDRISTKMASNNDARPSFLFPTARYDGNNGVPKSPKSPKVVTIENPLLKRPQFMLGATQMATNQTTTIISEGGNQSQTRSPLASLPVNRQMTNTTLGPPPKASLSLMHTSSSTEVMYCEVYLFLIPYRKQPGYFLTPMFVVSNCLL